MMQNVQHLPEYLTNLKSLSIMDRCFGCIFGQLIGDALGSYLEFSREITSERLSKALTMPGGGPQMLSPGQITDDSELAIELLRALTKKENEKPIIENIAIQYKNWYNSSPLDIGQTTRNALSAQPKGLVSEAFIQASILLNSQSLSNGALMRQSPLAIYGALKRLNQQQMFELVRSDTSLTHSHSVAQLASCIQFYTMQKIIMSEQDQSEKFINEIQDSFKNKSDNSKAAEELYIWWQDVEKSQLYYCNSIGFQRIAWVATFVFLKIKLSFHEAMNQILAYGGDTDTNACIVGAMIGAQVGFNEIYKNNPDWVEKILNCKPNNEREIYNPKLAVDMVQMLIFQQQSDNKL